MVDVELSVVNTFPILEALMKVENIGSAEVDIGKLAVEYKNQGGDVDALLPMLLHQFKVMQLLNSLKMLFFTVLAVLVVFWRV